MDAVELELHKENTAAFIAIKPVTIVLNSAGEKQRTPGGGNKRVGGGPRSPQTFRIIETSKRSNPPQVKVQDGTLREVAFWLLGEIGVTVEQWDWWTAEDGRKWTVADVIRSNEYEIRCIVTEYGE